jgi:hypothetical protein
VVAYAVFTFANDLANFMKLSVNVKQLTFVFAVNNNVVALGRSEMAATVSLLHHGSRANSIFSFQFNNDS